MHFTKNRLLRLKTIDKLGFSYLVALIGFASIGTIWSLYLKSFLGNTSYVGFFAMFFAVVSFLAYFFIIPIVEKNSKTSLLFLVFFIYMTSYFIFSFYSNLYLIIIIGIIMSIAGSLRITLFGLIVRDKSRASNVAKNEGLIFSFLNSAWFIGPILAGYISQRASFNYIFFFAGFLILISMIMFYFFKVKDNRVDKKIDRNALKVFAEFFKSRERRLIYLVSCATSFWWALIYVYMPIFIIENGFSSFIVGFFISAVVVPLIACEYYFGKMAGSRGFKGLFFRGHFLVGIIAIFCFFFPNPAFVITIMILASFGIAMVEPTQEAYFFDITKKNERDKFFPPYTTSIDMGHLTANLLAAVILLLLPFKFIFLLFGFGMLIVSCCSLMIRDHIEVKK